MPLRTLLAAALAAFCVGIFMQPVRAATGPASDLRCVTPESEALYARMIDPDGMVSFYRGPAANAFGQALAELFMIDDDPIAGASIVGVFVWSDPNEPVEVRFFDDGPCDLRGAETDRDTLAAILRLMGPSI